jgi:CO/xanthine dehydrogenase FAD-binding subunit
MSIGKFEYIAPETLTDAVALLEKHEGARVMAGGTDLMVKIRGGAISPNVLVSLKKIPGLGGIRMDTEGLTIGALTLLSDVAAHPEIKKHLPAIAAAAGNTANVQVRNMGTLVGNLCNASPAADNAPVLLVLEAVLHISGPDGNRELPLKDFFKGPGVTALGPSDIVTAIRVPLPPSHTGIVYQGFSARGKLDCSSVTLGVFLTLDGNNIKTARIAIGSCAPVPLRAVSAEALLTAKTFDPVLCEQAARKASEETRPINDLRASAAYRLQVVRVLARRLLEEAYEAAGGKGPV